MNTKELSQCIYILVILIDSVYIKEKSNYPQVFLEKYKHVVKKRCYILLLMTQKFSLMILMILITLMEKLRGKQLNK